MQTQSYRNPDIAPSLDQIRYAFQSLEAENTNLRRISSFLSFAVFVSLAGVVWLVSPWAALVAWVVLVCSLRYFARS